MLLAMDENGNVFETDSSRHDGLGMGRRPHIGEGGDVTLTSPVKFAEEQRARAQTEAEKAQVARDQKAMLLKRQKAQAMKRAMEAKALLERQEEEKRVWNGGQSPLLLEAVAQGRRGIDYDAVHQLSGFAYSADGKANSDALRGFSGGDFDMMDPVKAETWDQVVPTSEFDQPVDDGRTHPYSFKRRDNDGMGLLPSINLSSATSSLKQTASSFLQSAVSSVVGPSVEEVERQRQAELQRIQQEAQKQAIAQHEAQKAALEAQQARSKAQMKETGFMDTYKTPMLVGGGLIAMALVAKMALKR